MARRKMAGGVIIGLALVALARGDGIIDLTGHSYVGGFMMDGPAQGGTPGPGGWPPQHHGM